MKNVDKVLYKEVISPSLIALIVLTFVVFTRQFGYLAQMLIQKNANALTLLEVVFSLLPGILIFTFPLSFLIGVLIGFSRLSSDSEIVAMQAGGISLYDMVNPVVKVGIAVTLITALCTLFLLPAGNWNLLQIRHQIGLRPVQSSIKPRVFNEDLPNKVLYVEDIDLRTSSWRGVFLADTTASGKTRIILSKAGRVILAPGSRKLQLNFHKGSAYAADNRSPQESSLSRFEVQDVAVRFPEIEGVRSRPKRPGDKRLRELFLDIRGESSEQRKAALAELHSRVALPLSALLFAVLGVTLGVRPHRGGRSYGFVLSLTIAFLYYALFASGKRLASDGVLPLAWGVWGPNILVALAALTTLRSSASVPGLLSELTNNALLVRFLEGLDRFTRGTGQLLRHQLSRVGERVRGFPNLGFRITRVIDWYIMRSFFSFLLLALATCASLYYLFTFLELIDDIFANKIAYGLVLEYFLYLMPYIFMLLVPMSILLATLITFGILDKTSQIIALKSCGISLYRIFIPVLVLSLLVGAFLYIMQEWILPYSNQRQDNLRNVIKGHPIQTFYHPERKWIFGEQNRLYTYNYYDPDRHIFAELSIYQLDISENRLDRHVYAQKAEWDQKSQDWKLSNGWIRDFARKRKGFTTFEQEHFPLPEGPDYFVKEVKESSQMTYRELRAYIEDLQKGGLEVDHLKTELHKKVAMPMVNVIMAVLGVPFAFSMGRKGALFGVAIGVLIGILYWGAFGVFGVLGVNGLLSPLLAAWGPNILFGAGGLLLLVTVRT